VETRFPMPEDCKGAFGLNYYNDNDPGAAAWLRELIKHNLIPAGDVDERSITDVTGTDLKGYTQCHFFAGIGGWSEALRLAGWGTDRPVWTGSCPCQPFSSAGKGEGEKDPRHLWPEFYRLIRECKPDVVFGEQVERAIGMGWLDGVFADLETEDYTCGAAVLGAHSVNAPHIRQRLYWVADTKHKQHQRGISGRQQEYSPDEIGAASEFTGRGEIGRLGNSELHGSSTVEQLRETEEKRRLLQSERPSNAVSGLGHSESNAERQYRQSETGDKQQIETRGSSLSFWSDSILIPCRDGKQRRISSEPESFPLADGIPGRVGLLRGYGNAIVPEVAAEFIKAYMDIERSLP
jgi:DNA (cytosine-5)-methyltransferase 1